MIRALAVAACAVVLVLWHVPRGLAEEGFGTKRAIFDGFSGKIYFLPRGANKLPDFRKLKPQGTIYTRRLNVSPREFTAGFPGVTKRFEWFAIEFRSRLRIKTAGTYKFRLSSDDGSKLFIDGKPVIKNDGVHGVWSEVGSVRLAAGSHDIVVQYFQGPRHHVALQLFWTPPGGKEVIFPGGPGMLTTPGIEKPAYGYLSVSASDVRISGAAQVALILDSSGSMRAKLGDGTRRITAAKQVMVAVVNKLPDFVRVAFRVYGHRYPARPKRKSCRDSELLVPFRRLDRAAMKLAIIRLKPRGQTPIGYSLAQLATDFRGQPGSKLVLLVSDGIETCDPRPGDRYHPVKMIAQLKRQGIQVRVNVVGVDIGKDTTRGFLQAIAKAGDGRYIDARNKRELDRAVREGLSSPFDVSDPGGRIVAKGSVGRSRVRLKAGPYSILIRSKPPIRISRAVVVGGKTRALFVERRGAKIQIKRDLR